MTNRRHNGRRHFKNRAFACAMLAACFFCAERSRAQATQPADAPSDLAGKSFLTLPGDQWKLLWHDEFNGSTLDPLKWSSTLAWRGDDGSRRHHNHEYASYISDDNIRLSGGNLELLTRKQDITSGSGEVYHYTQAFIHTDKKFSYTFGYAEARLKVPTEAGPGLWPAFWTLSKGWPPEDDIAEFWTGRPLPHTHQGFAFRDADHQIQWQSIHKDAIQEGFHTFGMEWGPGYQVFNCDGVVTLRIYGDKIPSRPMYLILNSGVASDPPPPPTTTFPNTFVVDYVRVYSRPGAPSLQNAGFEDETLEPWIPTKNISLDAAHARTGRQCGRLDASPSSIKQTILGLKPQTRYLITAWIDSTDNTPVTLGIKSDAAPDQNIATTANAYTRLALPFTTSASATSAVLYLKKPAGAGPAFVDDISITESPTSPASQVSSQPSQP